MKGRDGATSRIFGNLMSVFDTVLFFFLKKIDYFKRLGPRNPISYCFRSLLKDRASLNTWHE